MQTYQKQQDKFASFCSHNYQKSLTNSIELLCKDKQSLIHCISQFGIICNKCSSLILHSLQTEQPCIICSNKLSEYLNQKQLCSHDDSQKRYSEITIKCRRIAQNYHQIPLKSQVCKSCKDKIKAAFEACGFCSVCQGKQRYIFDSVEKILASPALNYMKNIISALNAKNNPEIIKKQIELYCLAPYKDQKGQNIPRKDNYQSVIPAQFRQSYDNKIEQHPSKRYFLYPKCPKHRQFPLHLCNLCLVAVLNLECCPYGCQEQKKDNIKKKTNIKIMQTGFMYLSPRQNYSSKQQYLQIFIIRQIQEKGRLDRWQGQLIKSKPTDKDSQQLAAKLPLYSAAVYVQGKKYLLSGGKFSISSASLNIVYLIELSDDCRQFQIKQLQSMPVSRCSHALVYDRERFIIYAIGGYSSTYLKNCEYMDMNTGKWMKMSDLKVQRSKPSAFMLKNKLYVFGGLTQNPQISNNLGQRYNNDTNKWQSLQFDGYQYPFITGMAASTSLPYLQNSNIFLFGGSNYQLSTYYIQNIHIIQDQPPKFKMNKFQSLNQMQKMNYSRCGAQIGLMGCTAGDNSKKQQKIIVVFGGLQQHQPFLTIDAVRLRILDKQHSQVIFTYDQTIQIGSYRLLVRDNANKIYQGLSNNLIKSGLLNQQKFEKVEIKIKQNEQKNKKQQKSIYQSQFNSHLIQKFWYGIGKTIVWVPLGNQ